MSKVKLLETGWNFTDQNAIFYINKFFKTDMTRFIFNRKLNLRLESSINIWVALVSNYNDTSILLTLTH